MTTDDHEEPDEREPRQDADRPDPTRRPRATVGPPATADLPPGSRTLPASCRIKTQRDFRKVYRRGRRASGRWLTVVGHQGRGPGDARVGLSVGKIHGGAVRRNKLKRLLREAFRHERYRLPPGLDVVLIPQQRQDNFPLEELRAELVLLAAKVLAGGKPNRRPRPPTGAAAPGSNPGGRRAARRRARGPADDRAGKRGGKDGGRAGGEGGGPRQGGGSS